MIAARRIAALFALFGTLSVLLLATLMPPYQNADEGAHFTRADQVAHLGVVARAGPGAPALIDSGAPDGGTRRFATLSRSPDVHATRDLYAPLPWGARIVQCLPNTAIYPPFFYIPAAFAIRLGQRASFTVLPTLELARAASGLASVAIGTVAIALAGPAAIWLFAVLTLPMALAQMSAVSQDGPMIACGALIASLALRLQNLAAQRRGTCLGILCVAIAANAMARPPYAAFAVIPLLVPGFARWMRVFAVASILLATAAWAWISLAGSGVDLGHFGNGANAQAQLGFLLTAPWRIATIAYSTLATFWSDYLEGFIGKLGWLDVSLPYAYLCTAWGVLALAAFGAWHGSAGAYRRHTPFTVAAALVVACAGMFAIQFLTWTRVGSLVVDGIQGRYFLVPALIACLVIMRPLAMPSRLAAILSWPVLLFPIATIVITLHRVLLRYYL